MAEISPVLTIIKFEQANPVPGKELNVPAPDLFILRIHKLFGGFPIELDKKAIEKLEGMAACYPEPNPIGELIIAIRRLGSVRIWAEYIPSHPPPLEKENEKPISDDINDQSNDG